MWNKGKAFYFGASNNSGVVVGGKGNYLIEEGPYWGDGGVETVGGLCEGIVDGKEGMSGSSEISAVYHDIAVPLRFRFICWYTSGWPFISNKSLILLINKIIFLK